MLSEPSGPCACWHLFSAWNFLPAEKPLTVGPNKPVFPRRATKRYSRRFSKTSILQTVPHQTSNPLLNAHGE